MSWRGINSRYELQRGVKKTVMYQVFLPKKSTERGLCFILLLIFITSIPIDQDEIECW